MSISLSRIILGSSSSIRMSISFSIISSCSTVSLFVGEPCGWVPVADVGGAYFLRDFDNPRLG